MTKKLRKCIKHKSLRAKGRNCKNEHFFAFFERFLTLLDIN